MNKERIIKNLRVNATIHHKVSVDPIEFMKTLMEEDIEWRDWTFERDGKYYIGWDEVRGMTQEKEITKDKFEYIQAIKLIISYLEKKNYDKRRM